MLNESLRLGVSDSTFQLTGNRFFNKDSGEAGTDWVRIVDKYPGKYSEMISNHPERFPVETKEEFLGYLDRMQKLGVKSYRMSAEWGEIEREKGQIDQGNLGVLIWQLREAKKRDLNIVLTLSHVTLPQWLSEIGGWRNGQSVKYFKEYVEALVPRVADYVDVYNTVNEPMVQATLGEYHGYHPPFNKGNIAGMFSVIFNMARAHSEARKIIKKHDPTAKVGVSNHLVWFEPIDKKVRNRLANVVVNWFWNLMPLSLTATNSDVLLVNFYHHLVNKFRLDLRQGHTRETTSVFGTGSPISEFSKPKDSIVSDMDWAYSPRGFYKMLLSLGHKYPNKPIIVTETGVPDRTKDRTKSVTPLMIVGSLLAVELAIKMGVKIKGWHFWTLANHTDEWRYGTDYGFGVVDLRTGEKIPGLETLGLALQDGGVTPRVLDTLSMEENEKLRRIFPEATDRLSKLKAKT